MNELPISGAAIIIGDPPNVRDGSDMLVLSARLPLASTGLAPADSFDAFTELAVVQPTSLPRICKPFPEMRTQREFRRSPDKRRASKFGKTPERYLVLLVARKCHNVRTAHHLARNHDLRGRLMLVFCSVP